MLWLKEIYHRAKDKSKARLDRLTSLRNYACFNEMNLENLVNKHSPLYMSASIGPNDEVAVEHAPGEPYTAEDEAKVRRIPGYGEKIHQNRLTGQYIDEVYNELINSEEGQEYIKHLKRRGNGKRNPGKLETIVVTNAGEGIVAATVPDHIKTNLVVNADYIESWAQEMSAKNGLPIRENIKAAIIHELNHQFYQTSSQLHQSKPKVEFDNDFSLIQFYMGLAKKSPENRELYVKRAQLFAERYGGKARQVMDSYIQGNNQKSKPALESMIKDYIARIKIKFFPGGEYFEPARA